MCQVLSKTLAKALMGKTPRLLARPHVKGDHLGREAGSQEKTSSVLRPPAPTNREVSPVRLGRSDVPFETGCLVSLTNGSSPGRS